MPLTPIDIQQKTFGPELRGYNMDEVDDFLDEVVATLKDYDQRIRDAQDRIRALEAEVSTRGEDETAISRALVAAQKQADAVLEEAHQEAERIRSEAFDEADNLRGERDAERMTLTQDIARMRATVADLKRRVVELASSAGADLDAMDLAIADASDAVSESIPSEEPSHLLEEEAAVGAEEGMGDWGHVSEERGEHEAAGWEEEVSGESEPQWESPRREPGSFPSPYETTYAQEDQDQGGDDELGDLADEMAGEAAEPPSEEEGSAPPSRRPWERGSV